MTSVITVREDRKDIVDSLACRVFLDLQVQLVSRELQELSDQVDPGDHLDLLVLLERRDTMERLDQWDPQELVESLEKLDLRDLLVSLVLQVLLDPQDVPLLPLMTCLEAPRIMIRVLPLPLSSVRMRLFPTATRPPSCPWTRASWTPSKPSAVRLAA